MTSQWAPSCQTLTVHEDGIAVCEVRGDLDSSSMNAFRQSAGALSRFPAAVIDLSGVTFVDSAGLGAIIGVIRRARERDCPVVLVSNQQHTTTLFRTVGIDRIVPVVGAVEDALALVKPQPTDRHEPAIGSSDHRRVAL